MPLPKGGLASLSGMIDSDDDVDMMPSPSSNQENEPVRKTTKVPSVAPSKPRGRPPGKATAASKPKHAAPKRAPLKESANEQQTSDVEDGDELGGAIRHGHQSKTQDSEPEIAPKKRGRPPGNKAKSIPAGKSAATKAQATAKDGEFEYTPTRTELSKSSKDKKAATSGEVDAAEEDDENTMLSIEEDDVHANKTKKVPHSRKTAEPTKARSQSRRAASPSGDERGGDPNLRRKLGEMTRKFEALESRYRNLKEIGIVEAETNFDRLKKQSEQRTKAANDLIESLRNELEAQRSLSQEARDQNSSRAAAETRVTELTASLNTARKENQALQAKLARNGTESSARGAKVSSARPIAASNSELQKLQLKEDLYSDLTGLIVTHVTKQNDTTTYDCVQTGCNGTLNFKLSVTPEENAASYQDTEFSYDPRLNPTYDQELIDIMPDYLREEITFSRASAAKFYSRISDTVTKRIIED